MTQLKIPLKAAIVKALTYYIKEKNIKIKGS